MLAVLFFIACRCGFPAALLVVNQTANAGATVAMPVFLASGGTAVAGIQFDLQWDQSLAVHAAPGTTPGQSFKVLYTASARPGTLRCLIVGNNQASLGDGPLLNLLVTTAGGTPAGVAHLSLTNPLAASGGGDAVPLAPISALVQIQSGASFTVPAESVVNGASMLPGPVAPGEIITLFGVPAGSPSVLFNGAPATVIYAGGGQVNAVVPFGLKLDGPAALEIRSQNQTVAQPTMPVAQVAPAIFTQTGAGTGAGAVLNEDFSLNSYSNPAGANAILMVYGTGFGLMPGGPGDGQIAGGAAPLALPVTATIGGMPAEVLYAGAAPALVAGVTQINVRVPAGLPSNPFTPIVVSVGQSSTPPGITVSIR
jgi:uncharacterized protein (TIGR03437 family)